jgi:hypothetical protein
VRCAASLKSTKEQSATEPCIDFESSLFGRFSVPEAVGKTVVLNGNRCY